MYTLRYKDSEETLHVEVKSNSLHIVKIITDTEPNLSGFYLKPDDFNHELNYTSYTTLYRKTDEFIEYSNDGSVYVEPEETLIDLNDIRNDKINDLNVTQQEVIRNGIEVVLTDGHTERFTLTDNDQISLMELQVVAQSGATLIPWHNANHLEGCKYYTVQDFALISNAAIPFVTYHVTYFRDLRRYVLSLETVEEIEAVYYGMPIPEEFQSDVLRTITQ